MQFLLFLFKWGSKKATGKLHANAFSKKKKKNLIQLKMCELIAKIIITS